MTCPKCGNSTIVYHAPTELCDREYCGKCGWSKSVSTIGPKVAWVGLAIVVAAAIGALFL